MSCNRDTIKKKVTSDKTYSSTNTTAHSGFCGTINSASLRAMRYSLDDDSDLTLEDEIPTVLPARVADGFLPEDNSLSDSMTVSK